MIYPRVADLNGMETLVDATQMCSYKEHMTQNFRVLFLDGIISSEGSSRHLLLALDTLSHEPIILHISSPGGDLDSTFLLIDTIRMIKSPVITIGEYCASAACLLLATGSKRYLYPHAKVMLHLPAGQMGGDAKDWDIQHKQMEMYRNKVVDILCECGARKSREQILNDIDRDFWLEPEEAVEYGLADEILTKDKWSEICQE
jgi:ATP-dependent Clp protease protease subunit